MFKIRVLVRMPDGSAKSNGKNKDIARISRILPMDMLRTFHNPSHQAEHSLLTLPKPEKKEKKRKGMFIFNGEQPINSFKG